MKNLLTIVAPLLLVSMILVNNGRTSEIATTTSQPRAAGCLIPTPLGIVVGINRVLGTIQLPIGKRDEDESPQQTAGRETWEETGIEVEVGPLLLKLEKEQVYLFMCTPKSAVTDYAKLRPKDNFEVSRVVVINPHTMRNHDGTIISNRWRFPETRVFLRMLFPGSESEVIMK